MARFIRHKNQRSPIGQRCACYASRCDAIALMPASHLGRKLHLTVTLYIHCSSIPRVRNAQTMRRENRNRLAWNCAPTLVALGDTADGSAQNASSIYAFTLPFVCSHFTPMLRAAIRRPTTTMDRKQIHLFKCRPLPPPPSVVFYLMPNTRVHSALLRVYEIG